MLYGVTSVFNRNVKNFDNEFLIVIGLKKDGRTIHSQPLHKERVANGGIVNGKFQPARPSVDINTLHVIDYFLLAKGMSDAFNICGQIHDFGGADGV